MVTVFPAPYVTCTFASQPSRLLNCSKRFFPIISFSHAYLSFLPTTDLTCTSILKTALSSFSHRRSPEMRIARTPFKGKSASVAICLLEDISLNCFVRGFCDFQVQSVVVLRSQFIWPSPFLTPDPRFTPPRRTQAEMGRERDGVNIFRRGRSHGSRRVLEELFGGQLN